METPRIRRRTLAIGALVLALTSCSSTSQQASPVVTTIAPQALRVVAASEGCTALRVAAGETRVDMASGGTARWYVRHVPRSYTAATPIPIIVDLHGYSEGATIQTAASNLGKFGDAHGFVTITPEGSGSGRFVTWDTAFGSADVTFARDLLDQVERTLCVDTRRVFVTGYSQGAFMTSTLACVYADRIAAVATIAGMRDAPGCRPARPVPVIAFYGTNDRDIAYTGGLGPDGLNLPAYDGSGKTMGEKGLQNRPPLNGAPIPEIANKWARRNGCGGDPIAIEVTADVTRLTWPCEPSRAVELYRVKGGGHTWPGSAFTTAAAGILGRTTHSISADALIWRFFRAHPLRDP